jgi:hypothetical protein
MGFIFAARAISISVGIGAPLKLFASANFSRFRMDAALTGKIATASRVKSVGDWAYLSLSWVSSELCWLTSREKFGRSGCRTRLPIRTYPGKIFPSVKRCPQMSRALETDISIFPIWLR